MAVERRGGTTALDRLREHYVATEATCPECGYDDRSGRWEAQTTGDRVYYRHTCPSCGAVWTRTLRLNRAKR